MKKKRCYRTGAVFAMAGETPHILAQTDMCVFNLISLKAGSNRWNDGVQDFCPDDHISDTTIHKIIGRNPETRKTGKYKYLGQFEEVFERMGL